MKKDVKDMTLSQMCKRAIQIDGEIEKLNAKIRTINQSIDNMKAEQKAILARLQRITSKQLSEKLKEFSAAKITKCSFGEGELWVKFEKLRGEYRIALDNEVTDNDLFTGNFILEGDDPLNYSRHRLAIKPLHVGDKVLRGL